MKTRSQTWSHSAFTHVRARRDGDQAKYNTSCHKMPGLIHHSGLVQALVFQCARDADGRAYVDDLAATLGLEGHAALIERAQTAHLRQYLALTRQVSEIAQWYRRFAQIELGDDA